MILYHTILFLLFKHIKEGEKRCPNKIHLTQNSSRYVYEKDEILRKYSERVIFKLIAKRYKKRIVMNKG